MTSMDDSVPQSDLRVSIVQGETRWHDPAANRDYYAGLIAPLHGITDLVTWAVPPGLRPARTNPSLERFARDVVPRLKAAAPR